MKRLLIILLVAIALVATALIAPILAEDPGHVQLDIGPWRIETSVLVLVGAVIATWLALSLLVALFRLPSQLIRKSRERRSRRQLEKGFLALTEGDWQGAERALQKSLSYRHSTAGYLAAARAAQGRGDQVGRDRWLEHADSRFGRRHFITGLARARLMAAEGRTAEATAVLEKLHLGKPRHQGVLRLLLENYQELGRWRDLRLLTPALRRAGVVDRDRAAELAALAAQRELDASLDIDLLETSWKELPRKLRQRRELVAAYARRAAGLGRTARASGLLERHLSSELDDELLALYAAADDGERTHRIKQCEKWLESNPEHVGLQQTLGLLYLEDRQYERARDCLERVVQERPSSRAYAALGRVLDRAGKLEAAAQCYRNALRLRDGRGAEPLPPPP
ncbi:MAG: heme biosynthesis HemY N-terminal domain-containing protein [Xanthomonadales bacterium]|nr:heme biosynthesis HemY N-terminal domain-containing protein [Xanthomonadales bacterium]